MKPIFGTDITKDKNNEQIDGEVFAAETVPRELTEKLNSAEKKLEDILERANVHGNIKTLILAPAILGLLLILIDFIGDAYDPVGIPIFPIIGIVLIVVFVVVYTIISRRTKKALDSDETTTESDSIEAVNREICNALGVPAETPDTDILCFEYKLKRGRIVPESYWNVNMKLFAEGDTLCMVHGDRKYAVPLSEIIGIGTVKKRISIFGWNKNEPHNRGEYKKYKLREDKYGFIKMKEYCILTVNRGGEEYGLYFPPYELSVIEKLTGINAE